MRRLLLILMLLAALPLRAWGVDANLKPGDQAGPYNKERIQTLLAGDENITVKGGDWWFDTIDWPTRVGCPKVTGICGRTYTLPLGEPNLSGRFTRFISARGEPVGRLRGTGAVVEDVQWRGNGINRPKTLVEIEGRVVPATGRNVLVRCAYDHADVAVRAMAGYFEAGKFVPCECHADNNTFEHSIASDIGSFFRSENNQSVYNRFLGLDLNCTSDERHVCAFDIFRGGHLLADGVVFNHPWGTLFRTYGGGWSPWTKKLIAHNVFWDRPDPAVHRSPYATIFEFVPTDKIERYWELWDVEVDGQYNIEPERLNRAKLIVAPPWYDPTRRHMDLRKLTGVD